VSKGNKVFYGWWIVLVAFLSIALTYGTKGVFGVVQMQMLDDLHWTRGSIAGALSANMLVYAIAAPFVGRFMDKIGIKVVMIVGALFTGAAFLLSATVTNPWQFYIYYGFLLGLANTGMGMIPGPTAVSRWFIKKRGRALSIALVASPLGTAIFTFVARDLLKTIGWKGLFVVMGLAVWVLLILPVYFIMRSSPEEMGLQPDGKSQPMEAPDGKAAAAAPSASSIMREEQWTLSKLLSSPKAWCIIFGYFVFAGNGWAQQVHQVPHLMQMGLSKDAATVALGMNMTLAVISMLAWPSISDFMKRSTAILVSLLVQAAATFILLKANTMVMTYAFVLIMGLTYFGGYGLFSALAADTFGRRSLGTVNGLMAMVGAAGAAAGIYAGGLLYDITGNYGLLWQIGAAALVIAAILIVVLEKMPQRSAAAAKTL